MNANDLADRLEEFYKGTHITKAAEELRRLYANPAKKLTDEEIMAITKPMFVLGDKKMICDFAREILRKVEEK